jgi:hypothetical protein
MKDAIALHAGKEGFVFSAVFELPPHHGERGSREEV